MLIGARRQSNFSAVPTISWTITKYYKLILHLQRKTIKTVDETTGAVIPPNLSPERLLQFGSDNINVNKESAIAGHSSGFNATQLAGFQRGHPKVIEPPEIEFSSTVLEVPDVLH